jgi:hypothetical protein
MDGLTLIGPIGLKSPKVMMEATGDCPEERLERFSRSAERS